MQMIFFFISDRQTQIESTGIFCTHFSINSPRKNLNKVICVKISVRYILLNESINNLAFNQIRA